MARLLHGHLAGPAGSPRPEILDALPGDIGIVVAALQDAGDPAESATLLLAPCLETANRSRGGLDQAVAPGLPGSASAASRARLAPAAGTDARAVVHAVRAPRRPSPTRSQPHALSGRWAPHSCSTPERRRNHPSASGSVVAETLFLPGVGVVVVAVALPEAQLVVVEEFEAAVSTCCSSRSTSSGRGAGAGSRARAPGVRRRTCPPAGHRRHRAPTAAVRV